MTTLETTRDRLTSELEYLETVELPAAQTAVHAAQGVGDISENTDVRLALGEVARLRARINQIHAALVADRPLEEKPAGVVAHGRLVVLQFGDEAPETYLFGSVEDRHPDAVTLTDASPVGREIDGVAAGSVVDVVVNGRHDRVTVLEVLD